MAVNKNSKKTRVFVIIFLVVAILVTALTTVLSFGESESSYRTITVIEVTGTVGVAHNDIEYQAYTGMHLEEGYSVVTSGNSYIRLLLDDDKYVKLEAGSKATFEEVSGGKTAIRIERGSIVAEVTRPLEIDEDFIVNTPNAVLAVRGTLFRVDLSRNEKGEINTDVMTYGGAVSSKRVQPDGKVEDIELTIKQGFKATVNMDDKETVYLVDDIKVDLNALVGTENTDTTMTETNANGEIVNTPITLESILKPIVIEDIPDEDLVDIYFASENGHSLFVETEEISEQIEKREINIIAQTSVYEKADKIENPIEMVIPDDNVPLANTTEGVTEPAVMVLGPPTDGLGETTESTTVSVTAETATIQTTENTTKPTVSITELPTKPTVSTTEKITETTTESTTVHTHSEYTEEVKPTCTKTGKVIVKCSECGEILSEKIINKLGHATEKITVEATCTEDGKETEKCTVCGEIVSETVIEKSGHTTEKITVEATCTEDGKETEKCTVCGEIVSETVIEKSGHATEKITVEATCTEDGKETEKCTVCGEIVSETVIEKSGHTTEKITVEATCTEDGKETEKCTVCGETVSETILTATGHKPIYSGSKDAHTECEICYEILSADHTYTTNTVDATCTQDGGTNYICECGYNYTDIIPAVGHTETNAGEPDAHTKCSVCGYTLTDGTSHSYTDTETIEATCTTEGELTHTCSCGWSYTEEIPASHKKSVDGTTCSGCGGVWVDLNSTNFPDSMFLSYLSTTYDTDGNNALIGDEVTGVVAINVSGNSTTDGGYTDLTGIENFVNLTNINCSYNSNIETLDLSGLTSLTNLDVTGLTGLKTLNVSGTSLDESNITGLETCIALEDLNVSETNITQLVLNANTKLKTLDLSNCSALTSFAIDDSNTTYALQSVDLSGCTSLEVLTINNALNLTTVDFTDTTAIKTIDLGGCQGITGVLNVSNKTDLTSLTMGALIRVTSLNVTGCTNLVSIDASACSQLSTVQGLSGCTSLTTLTLNGTGLTSVDVTSNSALATLNVANCSSLTNLNAMRSTESTTLSSVTLTNCTALKTLNLYNCKGITTLDTTTLTALEELNLTYSGVTVFNSAIDTMDFTENVNLKNVYLNGLTSFTSFDVSANTLLEEFALTENTNVTSLDFSNNANLKKLNLSDVSSLSTLDISACTSLESFNVLNTGITTLSVTGSSNLTQFWVYNNTRLTNLSLTGATSLTSVKLSAGSNNATLTSLTLSNNGITSLDVTYLTQLSTLDVSYCSALETITGMSTAITNLNVTGCTALTSLDLTGCTALSTITGLDTCTSLNNLNVSATDGLGIDLSMLSGSLTQYTAQNATMTSIDLSGCAVLATLDVSGCTNLTTLNVTNCTSLTSIIGLDTLVALENLVATGSGLTNIDASLLTNLSTIDVDNMSNLKSLNISNTKVTILDVSTLTELSALEAKKCTALTSLTLTDSNTFTDLDISDCTNITEIDVSTCRALVNLNVSGTAIIALEANQSLYMETVDASDCTSLEALVMDQTSNNNLISVDVSGCTSMMCLQISNSNSLQELNLAGLTSLSAAYIDNCTAITSIDISNTRMSDISSLNIPSLTNFKTLKASDAGLSDSELAGMLKDTLEVIDISDNSSVTTIDLSGFENLKTLDISNSGITGLDTSYCLNLETVDAGDCTQLDYFVMSTGNDIEYIGLTSVNISGCTSMTMLQLSDAPNLETFDLSGLENLTEVYVQNCPKITSLDLSSAMNITLINVRDSGLTSGSVALPAGKDESIITGLS